MEEWMDDSAASLAGVIGRAEVTYNGTVTRYGVFWWVTASLTEASGRGSGDCIYFTTWVGGGETLMLLDFVVSTRLIIKDQLASGVLCVYSSLVLISRYTMKIMINCIQMMDNSILDSFHAVHVSAYRWPLSCRCVYSLREVDRFSRSWTGKIGRK